MASAPPYAMFVSLVQKPVLIVGAGPVALRKARGLVESAARVTVVSPKFCEGFDQLNDIERVEASYAATHMARKMWRLVFAATDVRAVNILVQKHAEAAGILCCRCDEMEEGDFISGATARLGTNRKGAGRGVSAVADVGGVTLVVSTAGASPVLSARICREAAAAIDPVLPALANLLADWRIKVKETVADAGRRRSLLQMLAGEEMERTLREQGESAAQELFRKWQGAVAAGAELPQATRARQAETAPMTRTVEHAE